MQDELQAWDNGRGIDLESWIACEGRFALAVGYATVFWPEFVELDGHIVRDGTSPENIATWASQEGATRESVEAVINHLHLSDIQHLYCSDCSGDKLLALGNVLKEIYEAKLAYRFPDKRFCVSLFIPDEPEDLEGYEITFWQSP
jgi:hypothetical protein